MMRIASNWTRAFVGGTALIAGMLVGTPVQAQESEAGAQQRAHCTMHVTAGTLACFGTFREAVADATGGRVANAPSSEIAVDDDAFARRLNVLAGPDGSPAAGVARVVLSIEYQHPGYRGATFTWYHARGCDSDTGVEYSVRNIKNHNSWWNDRISSFRGYSRCQVNHYEHDGFRGARTGFKNQLSDMGAMEDRTTSLKWR